MPAELPHVCPPHKLTPRGRKTECCHDSPVYPGEQAPCAPSSAAAACGESAGAVQGAVCFARLKPHRGPADKLTCQKREQRAHNAPGAVWRIPSIRRAGGTACYGTCFGARKYSALRVLGPGAVDAASNSAAAPGASAVLAYRPKLNQHRGRPPAKFVLREGSVGEPRGSSRAVVVFVPSSGPAKR